MSRIAILPSAVADQIAAGEVVERPASVVKELVENALDAGATTVTVTVEDGGRALIRIADNGSGMEPEDAVLSLARHATSKITSAEQLVGVRSFGFRGEALPAIASVSELELETATAHGRGSLVRVAGGIVRDTSEVARRQGTTVTVHRLFYNTPARQKFLRSARSEWRGILETMQAIAVLRGDVHFVVQHDGRNVLDLPVAADLRTRLAALWGHREIDRFVAVDDVQGPIHVTGLVERPADVGTATRRVLLIVNGRLVRDHGIVRAAESAYRSTIPAGVRPSLVLRIQLPAGDLDVNVHPAKAEVRFRDRWPMERVVVQAVQRALGLFDASAGIGWRSWSPAASDPAPLTHGLDVSALRQAPPRDGLFARPETEAASGEAATDHAMDAADAAVHGLGDGAAGASVEAPLGAITVPPLWQLRRTYLLFEHEDGVVLIDQHSAHERVLYERFLGAFERGDAPSQRLLFPLTMHLGHDEAEAFDRHRQPLAMLGYDIEPFGGHSLIVHAVPTPHPRFDAERCLRDTLAALTGDRQGADAARHERLAATVACKAAIKAGDALSPAEMRALFLALADTRLPAHDVHGRSTIVRLSWDELDRRFGRT